MTCDECDLDPRASLHNQTSPGLVRQIPDSGLRHLVELAGESLGCSDTSVLRQLRESSATELEGTVSRRASDEVCESLRPFLDRICFEVDQSLSYASRIGCKLADGPLLLSGGGAALPAIPAMMGRILKFEVVKWNWHFQRRFEPSPWIPDDSMFATALALAHGGVYA